MFEGFATKTVKAHTAELALRTGGDGPPVLLIHGYPQTHMMWHAVAPRLAERFTLVVPDQPGYGDSIGPPLHDEYANHSKRETARTMVAAMRALGHERFAVVGHDRGARVSYRLALDHPECVTRLALLDILPTVSTWDRADARFAIRTFHWGFLAQRAPFPETLISADPDTWMDYCLGVSRNAASFFDARALAAYKAAFRNASVVAASCEDYRAGAFVDPGHDRADRDAGRKIGCPTLLLWGSKSLGRAPESLILDTWRSFVVEPRGQAIDCGHFLAEEKPDATADALLTFLSGR